MQKLIVILCVRLPGDTRTKIGFLTFDSTIHFYNLQEGLSQPQMLVVSDIDGTFPPRIRPHSQRRRRFDSFEILLFLFVSKTSSSRVMTA